MDTVYAKAAVLLASVAMVAIRAPHGQRSRKVAVVESRKGALEVALLVFAWIAFFLPLIWLWTGWPASADFALRPAPFGAGVALVAVGLVLFHRSHADLGANWSITLEVREGHRLVTTGIYRRIRHPMYLSLLLHGIGQALFLPNWIAGPAYAVAMLLITACRLGAEERMMIGRFGSEYEAYRARTKRLIPGLW